MEDSDILSLLNIPSLAPPRQSPVARARSNVTRTRSRFPKTRSLILGLLTISLIGSVAAAGVLVLSQSFPSVPTSAALVTSSCTALTPSTGTVVVGTSGNLVFTCSGGPAFSTTTGSATPSFAAIGYGTVSFVPHVSGATTCTLGTALLSGSVVTLSTGSFDYCVSYASAPTTGFATFTLSWDQ